MFFQGADGSDVHGRRESIIGALGHVDVIIRVEQGLAGQFVAPVGDDFVDVHIALGPAAGLPDCQREIAVQFAGQDFVTDAADEFAAVRVEFLQFAVGLSRGFLQIGKGFDDLMGHLFCADTEILIAALGLGAPVMIGRDEDLTHGIMFFTHGRLSGCGFLRFFLIHPVRLLWQVHIQIDGMEILYHIFDRV